MTRRTLGTYAFVCAQLIVIPDIIPHCSHIKMFINISCLILEEVFTLLNANLAVMTVITVSHTKKTCVVVDLLCSFCN
jgi:hypothetical protein